jgi:hypothetical protein
MTLARFTVVGVLSGTLSVTGGALVGSAETVMDKVPGVEVPPGPVAV